MKKLLIAMMFVFFTIHCSENRDRTFKIEREKVIYEKYTQGLIFLTSGASLTIIAARELSNSSDSNHKVNMEKFLVGGVCMVAFGAGSIGAALKEKEILRSFYK